MLICAWIVTFYTFTPFIITSLEANDNVTPKGCVGGSKSCCNVAKKALKLGCQLNVVVAFALDNTLSNENLR